MFDPRKSLVQLRNNHTRLVKSAGIPRGMPDALAQMSEKALPKARAGVVDEARMALQDQISGQRAARSLATPGPYARQVGLAQVKSSRRGADELRALNAAATANNNNEIAYSWMSTAGSPPRDLEHSLGMSDRLEAFKLKKQYDNNTLTRGDVRNAVESKFHGPGYRRMQVEQDIEEGRRAGFARQRALREEHEARQAERPRLLQRNDGGVDVERPGNDYRPMFAPFSGWRR